MHRARLSTPALALFLLVVGCGDDDVSAATTTTTMSTVTSSSSVAEDATTTSTAAASPATTEAPDEAEEEVLLVTLAFAGGEVTSGAQRIEVDAGERVRLEVTSDIAEEVHVHGYDLEAGLVPGETAVIELTGDLPGVW